MNELITITTNEQGSLVVSTLDFAAGLGIQHKHLLETIRTHREIIERDFGLVPFETAAVKRLGERGTKHQTVAFLTEDQALFIGTLSRNSKRVVEFKSVLVQSFADARKKLLTASPSSDQVLLQLVSQQTQILVDNQQLIAQLRADVEQIQRGQRPVKVVAQPVMPLPLPPERTLPVGNLRGRIRRRIDAYCAYHQADYGETYTYLYRRLHDVYGVNVHRLKRSQGETLLDTLERYSRLGELYKLACNELIYSDQEAARIKKPTIDTMSEEDLMAILRRSFHQHERLRYAQLQANLIEASEYVGMRLGKNRAEQFIRRAEQVGYLIKNWEPGQRYGLYRLNDDLVSTQ